jgi:two-component system OmpR family sensor kinase/two-component system sensor histidine kinase BaeS
MNMDDSARQIRQRIFWIVVRAFIAVVFLTLLLVFIALSIAILNSPNFAPFNQLPIFNRIEGYYIGHGSWDGVSVLFTPGETTTIIENAAYLLDAEGRIIIDHGADNTDRIGTLYTPAARNITFDLKVDEEKIGSLVFDDSTVLSRLQILARILLPVSLISVFLALLAAVLVALLSRRIVTPLAEVIAASRAVTAGKLDARVQVQGTQDLLVLTDSFNQMAATLERNDRERRDLLADIAHELRTPISAIRGRLEGMLDGIYPADQHHISLALKANYLLERLVEDLRLLTLAESRQLPFEKKGTDLKALAVHSLEMFSAEAQEKDIQLQFMPAPGDFIVTLDPQRTEQVIGNLLGNALRYTPSGGKVWLSLEKTDTTITVTICDNGTGIHEADLPYIFYRFWRKDKSRARHTGGSGLGLAIAKQLIEAQGGTISAENLPEGGLKVKVTFQMDKCPF